VIKNCNFFEFDLSYYLRNKKEFEETTKNKKEQFVELACKQYKQKVSASAHTKIQEAKDTLQEELNFAKESEDNDLIAEINLIINGIQDLENTIDKQIEDLPVSLNILEWWPDLLYPAPKLTFEYTEECYRMDHIHEYFFATQSE
jgi:hypothetical protein